MSPANGQLPASSLGPVPGSSPRPGGKPLLRKDAAEAYTALAAAVGNVDMAIHEGTTRRCYRELAAQHEAKRLYGSDAATPGTSNHGWGLAVDLTSREQRYAIDQRGAAFGFSKSWSDASWEWWHILYQPGHFNPKKHRPPIHPGDRGDRVKALQFHLRAIGKLQVPAKGKPGRGHYGEATVRAVKEFQRNNDLTPDGIVGTKTAQKLRAVSKRRRAR